MQGFRSRRWIQICIREGSGSALKSKFRSFRGSKMEPWTLTMEAWKFKMKASRVCRTVVADSHHPDVEQDQDPDPH
jgi:hypothetical protein